MPRRLAPVRRLRDGAGTTRLGLAPDHPLGARPCDDPVLTCQLYRHLLPPIHTARCLVVDAPHDRTELAGRPVTFEGLRLADGSYVGWTVGSDAVALLKVARSGAPWWNDASTMADEADVLWDARVIGFYDSVEAADAAADAVFAERG